MGRLKSLDEAFHALLHSRSLREAFSAGRFEALGVSGETLAELRTIDPALLSEVAVGIAANVLSRTYAGVGSVLELYPVTIAAYRTDHPAARPLDLSYAFLESAAFTAYRELPFSGAGISLEEAFFRFAEETNLGTPADREREFHAAMVKVVAMSPSGTMTLPACLRRIRTGWFAVTTRGAPVLHAAVSGKLVTGPLTPFLAELLTSDVPHEETARRHRVGNDVLRKAVQHFAELGLLELPTAPRELSVA